MRLNLTHDQKCFVGYIISCYIIMYIGLRIFGVPENAKGDAFVLLLIAPLTTPLCILMFGINYLMIFVEFMGQTIF